MEVNTLFAFFAKKVYINLELGKGATISMYNLFPSIRMVNIPWGFLGPFPFYNYLLSMELLAFIPAFFYT